MDNKRDYPRFGRTITSDTAIAAAIVELWVELELTYAAVIYVDDAYGAGYNEAVLQAAEKHNSTINVKSYPFQNDKSVSQIPRALSSFKQWEPTNNTGCAMGQGVNPDKQDDGCSVNNILFVGFDQQVEAFYKEAVEQGALASPGARGALYDRIIA